MILLDGLVSLAKTQVFFLISLEKARENSSMFCNDKSPSNIPLTPEIETFTNSISKGLL
jgi:hypothetical protein